MAVAESARARVRLDLGGILREFTQARRRGRPGRGTPTLGDVIEAVGRETKSELELVATVGHLFDTRRVRWAHSPGAGADVRPAPCNPDGSPRVFD
jgi:hypothetical protein